MAIITKKIKKRVDKNPYFKDSYPTIEEAAKAKTDYLFNVVLKDFDVSQLTKEPQK